MAAPRQAPRPLPGLEVLEAHGAAGVALHGRLRLPLGDRRRGELGDGGRGHALEGGAARLEHLRQRRQGPVGAVVHGAHLAVDGVLHRGVHLLAHQAARQQAPDHVQHVEHAPDAGLVGAPNGHGPVHDLHGHHRAGDGADARAADQAALRGQPDDPAGDGTQNRAHRGEDEGDHAAEDRAGDARRPAAGADAPAARCRLVLIRVERGRECCRRCVGVG